MNVVGHLDVGRIPIIEATPSAGSIRIGAEGRLLPQTLDSLDVIEAVPLRKRSPARYISTLLNPRFDHVVIITILGV